MRLSLPAGHRACRRFSLLLAAVAALALGGATACNRGDTLTEADAERIAAAALLVVGDLPAGSWDEQQSQSSLGDLFGDVGVFDETLGAQLPEECAAIFEAVTDLTAILDGSEPLAVASRSFTSGAELFEARAIAGSVVVFADPADAAAAAKAIDQAFDPDRLEPCLLAAVDLGEAEGLQVTDFSLNRPNYALDRSTALRLEIRARALIIPIAVDIDLHAFERDHVLAIYTSLAINADESDATAPGLLETFEGRIVDAQN